MDGWEACVCCVYVSVCVYSVCGVLMYAHMHVSGGLCFCVLVFFPYVHVGVSTAFRMICMRILCACYVRVVCLCVKVDQSQCQALCQTSVLLFRPKPDLRLLHKLMNTNRKEERI